MQIRSQVDSGGLTYPLALIAFRDEFVIFKVIKICMEATRSQIGRPKIERNRVEISQKIWVVAGATVTLEQFGLCGRSTIQTIYPHK